MSAVKIHIPEVRLAKLIRAPGGKPVAEAMAAANAGLATLQADCLGQLQKTLTEAEALAAKSGGVFHAGVVEDLYRLISAAIGVPTTCGLTAMDTMLVSLSDLLDYLKEQQAWESNAIAVHLRAFRLLLHTEAARDGAGTQAILEGLRQVSQRFARAASEPRKAD